MPEGGSLVLRTSRHETVPVVGHLKGNLPRLPCVCLTIKDTGMGIKERHLDSIFDPFFTTKSKGSGLGLYNARIAMEKHQGAISVESLEGAGTRFDLWLPEADFSESVRTEAEAERKRSARRSLLLFGPAGEMLDKTAELLRSHNCHVVIAANPSSVLELLVSADYEFGGLMLMVESNDPSLDSLVIEARQQRKELKVVLKLAGCSQDDINNHLLTRIDLVLTPDMSEPDMLARLQALFERKT
jgi:hypothetical protein